mgnify:FL=1
MHPTIVITGASGRLGQACATAFTQAGWRVLRHSLRPEAAPLNALPDRADVLLHAANPPYTHWPTQAAPALQTAIDLSLRLGATLMLPGNVYNYQPLPTHLSESTPQASATRKGGIRIDMERMLEHAQHLQGLRSVVLRAGDFFGGGTGSWFDLALASRLRRGQFVYPGPLDVRHAWAYLPDLAHTFVALAQQRTRLAPSERLHFPGHRLIGYDWLQAFEPIAHEQGWLREGTTFKFKSLPWALMTALSPLVPMWREVLEMRYLWRQPHALVSDKLPALIGAPKHTPLPQAAQAALQALGILPPATAAASLISI